MLSDPIVLAYNSTTKTLPVAMAVMPGVKKVVGRRSYAEPNGEFVVTTTSSLLSDNSSRVEMLLTRTTPDNDADPFTGSGAQLPNSFGLVYVVNNVHYASSVDIPRLRAALLNYVDTATELRIIGGEI